MKVREENRNIVLLVAVSLACAFVALVAAAFDPAPSTVQTKGKQAALADQAQVRIVGVPFKPNTNPREH